ncbi:hypothetical protein V6N11_054808 [Hibiscus sabdariffa]|uniref:Uncharacterized protein n=1 Tax=Hibiscus sabdariffa TaxID=183260 RepID=A0ABR2S5W5_9ROSI
MQQRQPGNTQCNPQRNRVTCQICGRPSHTANVYHCTTPPIFNEIPPIIPVGPQLQAPLSSGHSTSSTQKVASTSSPATVPLSPPPPNQVSHSSQISSTSPPLQHADPPHRHLESTDHSLPSQPVSPLSTLLPTPPPIDIAPQPPPVHRPVT